MKKRFEITYHLVFGLMYRRRLDRLSNSSGRRWHAPPGGKAGEAKETWTKDKMPSPLCAPRKCAAVAHMHFSLMPSPFVHISRHPVGGAEFREWTADNHTDVSLQGRGQKLTFKRHALPAYIAFAFQLKWEFVILAADTLVKFLNLISNSTMRLFSFRTRSL